METLSYMPSPEVACSLESQGAGERREEEALTCRPDSLQITLERKLKVETHFFRKEMQMLVQRTIYYKLNYKSIYDSGTDSPP